MTDHGRARLAESAADCRLNAALPDSVESCFAIRARCPANHSDTAIRPHAPAACLGCAAHLRGAIRACGGRVPKSDQSAAADRLFVRGAAERGFQSHRRDKRSLPAFCLAVTAPCNLCWWRQSAGHSPVSAWCCQAENIRRSATRARVSPAFLASVPSLHRETRRRDAPDQKIPPYRDPRQ